MHRRTRPLPISRTVWIVCFIYFLCSMRFVITGVGAGERFVRSVGSNRTHNRRSNNTLYRIISKDWSKFMEAWDRCKMILPHLTGQCLISTINGNGLFDNLHFFMYQDCPILTEAKCYFSSGKYSSVFAHGWKTYCHYGHKFNCQGLWCTIIMKIKVSHPLYSCDILK